MASERQEFAHQSTCTSVSCPDLEVADLVTGSQIVVLYPSERERFFEMILGWPGCHGSRWVSIGDKSRMSWKDLVITAAFYDVARQCG